MISLKSVDRLGLGKIKVEGKFFSVEGDRLFIRCVTYGPFPDPQPNHAIELSRIKCAGFNSIRIYEYPSIQLLDAAESEGIWIFVGLAWDWERVFDLSDHASERAKCAIQEELIKWQNHSAVAGCYVANEIRPDLARWIGAEKVRLIIEGWIRWVKNYAPDILVAYASFPSSEFLEPANADFTAMNVYLENADDYRKYLRRLHHIAGDRPVLISEFGADSLSLGVLKQAEILDWGLGCAQQEGMAGWTCFSWSDRWQNGGAPVKGWQFGLIDSEGMAKPALEIIGRQWRPEFSLPKISIIVCVYNGKDRICDALDSLRQIVYPNYEIIVVDDGSTDGTRGLVSRYAEVRLITIDHQGLSVARNKGAAIASGEILSYIDDDCMVDPDYLFWLAKAYSENDWGACGGPNIPPKPKFEDEAVVASSPGSPSHVMLDDVEAEHIPGCHLSVRVDCFHAIGGFREQYRTAGDDVDFCWRLREHGYKIGFHGASFVWHRRRVTLMRYFKQQWGYGKAEAILIRDHPDRFSDNGTSRWEGCVYTGAAKGVNSTSIIYHGPSSQAGYQIFWNQMMPQRPLNPLFVSPKAQIKLFIAEKLQPILRQLSRWKYRPRPVKEKVPRQVAKLVQMRREKGAILELTLAIKEHDYRLDVLRILESDGWKCAGDFDQWDLVLGESMVLTASEMIGQKSWRVRVRFVAPLAEHSRLERSLIKSQQADSLHKKVPTS